MQVIRNVIAMLAGMLLFSPAMAAPPSAKGMAMVTFSGKLSATAKQDAMQKAKINAVDRYIADFNDQPKERNYSIIRNQVIASVDNYLLGTTVLSEDINEKTHSYSLVIRADINASRLENALKDSSAMATTANADKSSIIFVFVARQQKSVQSFDDKVYKRADTQRGVTVNENLNRNTSESEKVSRSKVDTADSGQATHSATRDNTVSVTTGGSVIKKNDLIEWDIAQTADINTITAGVMTNAGYDVVDTDNLDPALMQAIRKDYSSSNDLSPATTQMLMAAAKELDIPYVAVGTLDVGVRDTDPVTGNVRVYVKVNERVLTSRGRLFKTAAAVGPVDYHGLGASEDNARTNALKSAAGDAAQQLMNALNAKGVQ
jgi:hypothetical protein